MTKTWVWIGTFTTAVLTTITTGVIRDYVGPAMRGHMAYFALLLLPYWLGAIAGLVAWAVLTVYRIAGGRDKEFQAWLKSQGPVLAQWYQQSTAKYEQKLRDQEAKAEKIYSDNSASIKKFYEDFPGLLAKLQTRIEVIEDGRRGKS